MWNDKLPHTEHNIGIEFVPYLRLSFCYNVTILSLMIIHTSRSLCLLLVDFEEVFSQLHVKLLVWLFSLLMETTLSKSMTDQFIKVSCTETAQCIIKLLQRCYCWLIVFYAQSIVYTSCRVTVFCHCHWHLTSWRGITNTIASQQINVQHGGIVWKQYAYGIIKTVECSARHELSIVYGSL